MMPEEKDTKEDEAAEFVKERLLDLLTTLRRKIVTGEILGLMVFAEHDEDVTTSWRRGCSPSAPSLVQLRSYLRDAEEVYLERVNEAYDNPNKPSLKLTYTEDQTDD